MQLGNAASATSAATTSFIIRLEGEFDLSERDRVTDAFAVAQTAGVIVVDLHRCEYIDSTILQCLMALYQACRKRGAELILTGLRGPVRRLFEVIRLDKVLDIRSTLDDVGGFDGAPVRRLTIEARAISG